MDLLHAQFLRLRDQSGLGADALITEAASKEKEELVEKLIELGASPTKALIAAAIENNKELASRMIELGADVHQALYETIKDLHLKNMKKKGEFLIELGADANIALLGFASKYDYINVKKEIQADKLINVFGADPLLVSIYVEEGSKGFKYLSEKYKGVFQR